MTRRWTIRNYNCYIREMRKTYGLDLVTARLSYRIMRPWVKQSLVGVDVKRHPRYAKRAANAALERRQLVAVAPRTISELLQRRAKPIPEWEEYNWRVYDTA